MKMSKRTRNSHCNYLRSILFLVFLLTGFNATATSTTEFSPSSSTIALPSSLTLPANTAVGKVVYTSEAATTSMTSSDTGDYTFTTQWAGESPTRSSYGNNVYETGIAGLGFRVKGVFRTNQPKTLTIYWPDNSDTVTLTGSTTPAEQDAYLELIVTSNDVASGEFDLSAIIANMHFDEVDWAVSFSGTTTVTATSCEVNTYDTSVDLGTAYTKNLTEVGTTAQTTDFSINMTCSASTLKPSITFSGTPDSNVSAVFSNDSGTATGVGVQLLYGDTVITPDTVLSLGKPTSTSATDYDFKARLYQTASTVTAGSVDTTVTFTVDYE
ncbi:MULTISPECIES: fimbrial protein [Lonsdalea]|uniref:fimbrial protein n=1 Tax=Lonsdalea TaxID=1082702 RepID=UPI000A1DE8D2|nr:MULTISPECIES: fimbrial protein [Lonsdalea]